MKKNLWIVFSSILISFLLPLLFYQTFRFLAWVDLLFMMGLVLILVGAVMTLIAGQFFSAFLHSWKRFFTAVSKKEQVIQKSEGKEKQQSLSTFNQQFPSSKIFVRVGLSFCLISFLFSILIVYFDG